MTSRYLTNVLLILLVAGLYWFNNQSNTTDNDLQTITDTSSSEIRQITIERAHLDNIILEKRADDWLLSQPFKARANSTRIKLLLSLLSSPSYSQLAHSNDETLAKLGLLPAKRTLHLNEHSFQFGDVESISNRRYVRHNDTIHLVDDQVSHLINANASSFIDNRLIQSGNVIEKMSLPALSTDSALSEQTVVIENGEGQWKSDQKQYNVDQLTTLISVWTHAYALRVLPIKDQQITNIHKIHIWYKNQQKAYELRIELTNKALFIYDLEQQLKYQFPAALTQQLFPPEITTP